MIYTERVRGVLNKKLRLLCAITMLWGCMTTGLAKNYDDKELSFLTQYYQGVQ